MFHYALCLKNANLIMANSTWTKNHVDSLRNHADHLLEWLQLLPPLLFLQLFTRMTGEKAPKTYLVYPPCDTREMAKSSLEHRERIILSIAQFRYGRLETGDFRIDVSLGLRRTTVNKSVPSKSF